MADAKNLMRRQGLQIEMNTLKETQRAFRTYQKLAKIRLLLNQCVNIIATHSPEQIGKSIGNFLGLALSQIQEPSQ